MSLMPTCSSLPAAAGLSSWEAVLQALAPKSTAKRLEVEGYLRDLDRALTTASAQLDTVQTAMRDAPRGRAASPSKQVCCTLFYLQFYVRFFLKVKSNK